MKIKNLIIKMIIPIVSILCAFIIGAVIIACLDRNPIQAYQSLFDGALGSSAMAAQTLVIACPLIFTSLAAAFAYKCGVFNLGGEGQFMIGAVTSTFLALGTGISGIFGIIVSILAGTLAGAVWGAIPGILKIKRGLNEMIVSIMLNYVALLFMGYVYTDVLRDGSVPQTAALPDTLRIPNLSEEFHAHFGVVLAVLAAIVLMYVIYQTSFGFKIRGAGYNPVAAGFSGFPVNRLILLSFIISGGLAGMGGSVELHGRQFRLLSGFGDGVGFDGVAIALIAQLNPAGSVVVAFFFAVLRKGAGTLQAAMNIPTAVVDIIQALVIVFAVAGTALIRNSYIQQFIYRHTAKHRVNTATEVISE